VCVGTGSAAAELGRTGSAAAELGCVVSGSAELGRTTSASAELEPTVSDAGASAEFSGGVGEAECSCGETSFDWLADAFPG
jgi:hypothetical protein